MLVIGTLQFGRVQTLYASQPYKIGRHHKTSIPRNAAMSTLADKKQLWELKKLLKKYESMGA
jgi:hypothetical protein